MSFDEFFTDSDKPFAENLNDALVLADAFDLVVPVELPVMFSNGEFSSSVNVPRKCGVGIVTLKSVDSGVTVGTSSISGSGEVVFRVYPNFNSFYKWSKIVLEKSGTVSIGFKKTDGTSISASVGSDGTISDANELKNLQEIDVVLSLTSATINSILIEFINNQTNGRTRTGALLEASQLTNVDGTISAGETKAVNGDTVYNALTDLDDAKEDVSNKVTSLDNSATHYPSCKAVTTANSELELSIDHLSENKENISNKSPILTDDLLKYPTCNAVKTVTDTKEDSSNKVTSLDSSDTHYPTCNAVKTVTDSKLNNNFQRHAVAFGSNLEYEEYRSNSVEMWFITIKDLSMSSSEIMRQVVNLIPNTRWAPKCDLRELLPNGLYAQIGADGTLKVYNPHGVTVSNLTASVSFMYVIKEYLVG